MKPSSFGLSFIGYDKGVMEAHKGKRGDTGRRTPLLLAKANIGESGKQGIELLLLVMMMR